MTSVIAGIGWHIVGASMAASFYAPIERVKKWSWETTWALAGLFSWVLLPIGVSLVLFVLALRNLGSARAGAYFSVAPFFGTVVALLLGDALTWQLIVAAILMVSGVWLHITERHAHEHIHEYFEHSHGHVHDEHHQHSHDGSYAPEPHTHLHVHVPLVHSHRHYPDVHHRHPH